MNVSDQINSVINNLTDKLGVAADKLYPVLIKQVYISAMYKIAWVIVGILIIVATLWCIKMLKRKWWKIIETKDHERYKPIDDNTGRVCVVGGLILSSVIGISITIIQTVTAIAIYINPDWYALQMILNQIK